MAECTTIMLEREFVEDVGPYLEAEPFGSVEVFVKPPVRRGMAFEEPISEREAKQIG